jgi:hypothetical protein
VEDINPIKETTAWESFTGQLPFFYWFNSFFGTPIRLSIDGTITKRMQTTP